MRILTAGLLAVSALLLSSYSMAATDTDAVIEEMTRSFNTVVELVREGEYRKAVSELSWVEDPIMQLDQQKTAGFLPDELNGFTGGEIEINSGMGMSIIERTYTRDGESITLSLAGGASAGAASGFAALGALAQFGMGNAGSDRFRLQGVTFNSTGNSQRVEVLGALNGGRILNVSSDSASLATVKSVLDAAPLSELNAYLND